MMRRFTIKRALSILVVFTILLLAACNPSPSSSLIPSLMPIPSTPFSPDARYIRLPTTAEEKPFAPVASNRYYDITPVDITSAELNEIEERSKALYFLSDEENYYILPIYSSPYCDDMEEFTFTFFCLNADGSFTAVDLATLPIDQAFWRPRGFGITQDYVGYIDTLVPVALPRKADTESLEYFRNLPKRLYIKSRSGGDPIAIAEGKHIVYEFWGDYVLYCLEKTNTLYRYNLRTKETEEMIIGDGFWAQGYWDGGFFQMMDQYIVVSLWQEDSNDYNYYNFYDITTGELAYCFDLSPPDDAEITGKDINIRLIGFDGRYILYSIFHTDSKVSQNLQCLLYDTHTSQTHTVFNDSTNNTVSDVFLHGGKVFFEYNLGREYSNLLYYYDPGTKKTFVLPPNPQQLSLLSPKNPAVEPHLSFQVAIKDKVYYKTNETYLIFTLPSSLD